MNRSGVGSLTRWCHQTALLSTCTCAEPQYLDIIIMTNLEKSEVILVCASDLQPTNPHSAKSQLVRAGLKAMNARALQTSEPPAYKCTDSVKVLGEDLAKPVHWTGKQWAVTAFGIEARDGQYPIPKGRVWEENRGHGWIEHLAEKAWVDIEDFTEALRIARSLWAKPSH